jgi:hypothetical protein
MQKVHEFVEQYCKNHAQYRERYYNEHNGSRLIKNAQPFTHMALRKTIDGANKIARVRASLYFGEYFSRCPSLRHAASNGSLSPIRNGVEISN